MPSEAQMTVGLVQISEQVGAGYYFPYTAGCLQAYVQQEAPEHYRFLPLIYRRLAVPEALEALAEAEFIGFSVYIWNLRRSLALAQALKAAKPQRRIVFGGPQVPERPEQAEAFLRAAPFIDVCVHGAGEETLLHLLEQARIGDWSEISELQGISWLDAVGDFHARPPGPRQSLDHLPSPYLTGVFEPLLAAEHEWKGVWETNRGCPFACSFCDWGSATASKVLRFPLPRVLAEADWFGRKRVAQIYLTDANFGLLPRDLALTHEIIQRAQHWGFPRTLMTQAAKNSPERVIEIHRLLAQSGLQTLAAISLQTVTEPVLTAIRRQNISLQAFAQVQQACHRHGVRTYTDLIIGLPGETLESFAQGLEAVLESGQLNFIQFYDAAVLPNAELADPTYRERHGLEVLEIPFPSHPRHPDGIEERLPIVIASRDMPRAESLEAHVLAWSTLFWCHKHKLLQVVLLLLRHLSGRPWIFWIAALMRANAQRFPMLAETSAFFRRTAKALQQGSISSQLNSNQLQLRPGVMLSPELSLQIRWVAEGHLHALYQEAFLCFRETLVAQHLNMDLLLLEQAFLLNQALFLELLHQQSLPIPGLSPYPLYLDYDLPAFYRQALLGQPPRLQRRPRTLISRSLPQVFGAVSQV